MATWSSIALWALYDLHINTFYNIRQLSRTSAIKSLSKKFIFHNWVNNYKDHTRDHCRFNKELKKFFENSELVFFRVIIKKYLWHNMIQKIYKPFSDVGLFVSVVWLKHRRESMFLFMNLRLVVHNLFHSETADEQIMDTKTCNQIPKVSSSWKEIAIYFKHARQKLIHENGFINIQIRVSRNIIRDHITGLNDDFQVQEMCCLWDWNSYAAFFK